MAESIPMVVFSVVHPFIEALHAKRKNTAALLQSVGLPDERTSQIELVPIQAWYNFAELVANVLSDHHSGFKIGYQQSIKTMADAGQLTFEHATLGEILSTIVIDFNRIGNYSSYEFVINGNWAAINAKRLFNTRSQPVQIDAYSMGHMVQIISHFAGSNWDSQEFRASVVDPSAIPVTALPSSSVTKATSRAASIKFPADWTLYCENGYRRQKILRKVNKPDTFINDFRKVIEMHLSDQYLSIETLAVRISKSPATLSRILRQHKTSFKLELNTFRFAQAKKLLADSDAEIASIGAEVGYPNASSFARAFRQWAGKSPSEFRRNT